MVTITGGSGTKGMTCTGRQVADLAGAQVDLELVLLADAARVALQHGQADVDGVAEEDAREALRQHGADAGELDDARRVLAARAQAEVAAADDEVAGLHLGGELRPRVLQHVLGELGQVGAQVEQAARARCGRC